MRKILTLAAALAVAGIATGSTLAATTPPPFPSPTVVQVFVAAQTVTPDGALASWFAPGSTVVFRAYAVDVKSKKFVAAKDKRYFYVTIPGQPNVKLTYNPSAQGASPAMPWTGTWTVPADYQQGTVGFRVLIQTMGKTKGQFVQMPVATSMLTVSKTAPPIFSPAPTPVPVAGGQTLDVALYVDSVNGTRPAGAAPRPVGCSQTNVFKRGEQLVLRSWGSEIAKGSTILSNDNVTDAHFSIAGQPDVKLNWGAHGTDPSKVFFWTNAWSIPKDFPLGNTTIHVVFTTDDGKTVTYDHVVNIIP